MAQLVKYTLYLRPITNGFGIIGLQTDDSLILADKIFAETEENRLRETGFLSKDREKLTPTSPIKLNGGQIEQTYVAVSRMKTLQGLLFACLFDYDHFRLKETSTFKDRALDVVVRNRQII